ncbi:MAG: hypothetical protein JXR96_09005 [Deltaproteobacteria bacterium]|nr:hypothetical protein [Deltaproteobacteria bacterium]
MRLYEVTEVRPGASIRLRDLLGAGEHAVEERLASQQVARWDLLAARILIPGPRGAPVIEGSPLPIPRSLRERLLDQLADMRADLLDDPRGFDEQCAPFLCQAFLQPLLAPSMPRLVSTDGEEVVFSKSYFDVIDEDALSAALDGARELDRAEGEAMWTWDGPGKRRGERILVGTVFREGGRLVLECATQSRAEKGRKLLERLAGEAVRFRVSAEQDPVQAMAEMSERLGDELGPAEPEIPPEEIAEIVTAQLERHYRGWLDEEIPALDGHSPRQAARSSALRPRLVELIKDLENMYQRALASGQPGFDPSWLWAELGIEEHPQAPGGRAALPLTGFESLERQIPGIGDVARKVADRFRRQSGFDADTVISPQECAADPDFDAFVQAQARAFHSRTGDGDKAADHGNLVGSHLESMCNFELHRRKTFWVDDALAWMLGQTRLEIEGEHLKLPFACFALVFTDRESLRVAESMLSADPDCELRGRILKIATAYVTRLPADGGMGLRVAFTFDALAGQWPYLVSRDLLIRPEARLEAILDSHFPDVDVGERDPIFSSAALKKLLHLVVNAILYATSAGVEPEIRRPAAGRWRGKGGKAGGEAGQARALVSAEEVFFLPGKIDIRSVRQMQEVERAPSGRKLMHRFMVRGHWRRAAASWKDQRPRWIKPHWKGPEIAVVLERAYRMRP